MDRNRELQADQCHHRETTTCMDERATNLDYRFCGRRVSLRMELNEDAWFKAENAALTMEISLRRDSHKRGTQVNYPGVDA